MRQVLCPVLVGREDELQVLLDALDGAVAGRGGTAVVLGEAGAGKSRMVRELAGVASARLAGDDPALAAPIGDALVETLALAGQVDRAFGLGERLLARLDRAPGRPPGRVGLRLRLARAAVAAGRCRWPPTTWPPPCPRRDQGRRLRLGPELPRPGRHRPRVLRPTRLR